MSKIIVSSEVLLKAVKSTGFNVIELQDKVIRFWLGKINKGFIEVEAEFDKNDVTLEFCFEQKRMLIDVLKAMPLQPITIKMEEDYFKIVSSEIWI